MIINYLVLKLDMKKYNNTCESIYVISNWNWIGPK